ncbi:sulfonate ABC transporter substrate-binding protein [Longimycelium tulufanense]|uniref:Sulfonate ABC transporter substrate-binding protein n=1 Tax=Longimycelium tulufanense TaxID=907463 RepID=A0A8J3CG34_9PSEU|nr:ABC transporter substrate-binding protein [Longimycelium tulufanense]GGM60362.1 sulfonate ABC transporter substrate-binding protein [Longimycelium tulufanense]
MVSRRALMKAAMALGAAATVGGCGEGEPAASGERLERTKLKVGVVPVIAVVPMYLAVSEGLFATEGLEVELLPMDGGADALKPLTQGGLDLAFVNYVSAFQAYSKGAPLRIVADAYQALPNLAPVVVLPNSQIRGPAELAGKRIAVNQLNNIGTLTIQSLLRIYDVDDRDVRFVEVPFPQMPGAMVKRVVDAAWLPEPFLTGARMKLGVIPILDPGSGPTEGMPIVGYISGEEFVKDNPRTLVAFRRALMRAGQVANEKRVKVEEAMQQRINIDEDITRLMKIGEFPLSTSVTRLQRVADLMRDFGMLKTRLDVTPMVAA